MRAQAADRGGRAGLVLRAAREQDAPVLTDDSHLSPPTRAWVLEQNGQLIGILLCEVAPDHLLPENIAVDPAHRGQGPGALLLDQTEQHACDAGMPEVRLCPDAATTEDVDHYPRRGYLETHRADQEGYRRVFSPQR